MEYNLWIFSLEFVIFFILYFLVIQSSSVKNYINKIKNFKLFIFGIFLVQLLAITLIKYDVVDVFINSDAGKNLLDSIDIYWIDADHGKYPFFPFLIFLHAGLVFIWQKLQFFSYNFYFKIVLLAFLHFLGLLFYREWRVKDLKSAKLNLVAFLLSPITYAIVLYHGQFDIILITFLYLAIRVFKSKNFFKLVMTAIFYAISIASKTWSIIILPLFAIPALKKFSIREFLNFIVFIFIVIGLLLINIKFYTLQVFGSSTRVVLNAIIHPGGPIEIWGLGLMLKPFFQDTLGFLSKLQIVGLGSFWLYIYYKVRFLKKKYNYFSLVLMTIFIFHILTPRWGIQYIFWHFPFLFLLTGTKMLNNWIYQWVIPIYLFMSYFVITAQWEIFPSWIIWILGLLIYFNWVGRVVKFLKN